ncbi:unnamed protein product [Paramecium sonneborni]|uniref:Uncharacterized protein n=1 Tax=Paramecium sonneborni TaxID=65129 RepID=A0A8S1QXX7_9CILI|nr:unnamed protein product [Paramecium sonneborni]
MRKFLLNIELFNLFLVIQIHLVCSNNCTYESYDSSLLSQDYPQEIQNFNIEQMDLSRGNSFSFGFWSQCIPLWNPIYYPTIQGDYRQDLLEHGQFLYQIMNGNKISVISYVILELQSLKVGHVVDIQNNKNAISLLFNYPPQDYEGKWIFTFITIQPQMKKIIIQMDDQLKYIQPLEIISNIFTIIIGGRGYTDKLLNLNLFKGRLSKLYWNNNWFFNENMHNFLTQNCKIAQISEKEEIVMIIKGLQYFDGQTERQGYFDQFGNKYCISGWMKVDITQIDYYSKMPIIRITAFKNYGSGKNIGDELMKLEIEINKIQTDKTKYILTSNLYGIPKLSLQSQYSDLNSILSLESCCGYYLNGVQQWHFIQYEYGRQQKNEKIMIQIQFSNELGIQTYLIGSTKYQSSFINSRFYYLFGGDYFTSKMLQAFVSDFKVQFNYQKDKDFMKDVCYYSCETCNGPQQTNCLSCNPDSNRVFLNEENKCQCQQGYIDYDGQKFCVKFENRFPSISQSFIINEEQTSCQYGYFLVPRSNQCVKCPQENKNDLLCVDCLQFPLTWYQQTVCTMDFINQGQQFDSAYQLNFRDYRDYDFYFLDDLNQLNLQQDRKEEKCVLSREKTQGYYIYVSCKPNYYINNNDCQEINSHCLEAQENGNCRVCIDKMYPFNNKCNNCPIHCQTCNFNQIDQEVQCTSCSEKFTLKDKQCQPCGSYCQQCQHYYDNNSKYSYLKCMKCIDDSKYFLSFDGINCQQNKIENCLYAFQYLKSDQKVNTIDQYFELQFNQQNIMTSCARCLDNFIFVLSEQVCLLLKNSSCVFGYAQQLVQCDSKQNNLAYSQTKGNVCTTQQICLITNSTVLEEVQFIQSCTEFSFISQCEICIQGRYSVTDQQNIYDCLNCQNGYYLDKLIGKCFQCPSNLKCFSCYQQHKLAQDNWKVGVRAFYKVFIEKDDEHPFKEYGQSQMQEDYEIKCSQCLSGYQLINNQCIQLCSDSCLLCQFIDEQYYCLKCKFGQNGRRLTLYNNQCIDCQPNCALCRVRSNEEIFNINPLFNNQIYIRYSHQCLKTYTNTHNIYDQQLGMFIKCLNPDSRCYLQYNINLNLYCSQIEYENDRDAINDQFQRQQFMLENILVDDLISESSFKEANEKLITSIKIYIQSKTSQKCIIPEESKIQQIFSQNIFSAINVELEFNFSHEIQFVFQRILEFKNFNSIKINNLRLIPYTSNKLKQIIFTSCFPLTVKLSNILFYSQNITVQSQLNFINVSSLQIINFTINEVYLEKSDKFIKVVSTEFSKLISIDSFYLLNSRLDGINLIHLELKQYDIFTFMNSIFKGNFYNSTIISTQENQLISKCYMKFIQIESNIQDCQSIFNLFWFSSVELSNFIIQNSQLFKTSLIKLNNNSTLNEIHILKCQLIEQSVGIFNSELASYEKQFIINISNITFESNKYDQTIKLLNIQKFTFMSSQLEISNISIINNEMISNQSDFNQLLYESSLIYFSQDEIIINRLQIQRGYGLIDICFFETKYLQINNAIITQGQEYKFQIHQYLDCLLKYIKGQYYLQSLFIYSCVNLTINDIIIQEVYSTNSPIISYQSALLTTVQQTEQMIISDVKVMNNLLLITEQKFSVSIIKIESVQISSILFSNITFINNIMQVYIQDNLKVSALLLNLDCQQGQIILIQSHLSNNIVFNSTNSLVQIKSKSLDVINCQFLNNSIFNYQILQAKLLWGFSDQDLIFLEDIQNIFQIKSSTGNALFIIEELNIMDCLFSNSQGSYGGAFQIIAQNYCNIKLIDLSFDNVMTSFQEENEQGGGLFIDSSSALSLNINIRDIRANTIFSRYQGGLIYLKAGSKNINVTMDQLILNNIHSLQGSIFYVSFQSQSSYTKNLQISNILIKNSYRVLLEFLNKYDKISTNQEYALNNNKTLFFIEFGQQIKFQNIFVENLLYESFLQLSSTKRLNIINLQIINSKQSNFLVHIESNQFQSCQINFHNILIQNTSVGQFDLIQNNCPYLPNPFYYSKSFQCFSIDQQVQAPSNLIKAFDSNYPQDFCWRNLNQNLTDMTESGLILLTQLYDGDLIELKDIYLIEINCSFCQKGLLSFNYKSTAQISKSSSIQNIFIRSSSCGKKGCFNLFKNNQNRLLFQYNEQQKYLLDFESIIKNYICENNQCKEGTCINSQNIIIHLQDCNFQNNYASLRGGAIYTNSEILIYNCQIQKNIANVGGGIYQIESIQYPVLNNQIYENMADNFGENIISIPDKLALQIYKMEILPNIRLFDNDQLTIDQVYIKPYKTIEGKISQQLLIPSGQAISKYKYFDWKNRQYIKSNYTFHLVLLNQQNQIIKNLKDTSCRIQSRIHNILENQTDQDNFLLNFTNLNTIKFDDLTQNYNLDNMIIYLDNELPENLCLLIEFICNSIQIPIFNKELPYNLIGSHNNYKLRVEVRTLPCQFGEIKSVENFSCILCDDSQGLFSLKINQPKCQVKDDVSTISVNSSQLNLKQGFWRPYIDTNKVSNCLNLLSNCLGGLIEGDQSCTNGHIGALCEECDLYNTRGDGEYSISQRFTCGSCQEIQKNTVIITLVSFWTLISVFISVQGTIKATHNVLPDFKFIFYNPTQNHQDTSAILMKLLTNYLQILDIISTFQLDFSEGLQGTLESISSPFESMIYSLDCFLSNTFKYEIHYARMIWELITPFFYISFFFFVYFLASKIRYATFNKSVITTTLIYMYIYLQPTLIGGFMLLISYREISDYKWISSNVSYRYDSDIHQLWIFQFCLPSLFTLSIIIPFYLLFGLYQNRNKFHLKMIKQSWGYLYLEYRNLAYYWEIVKIFQRELIILTLTYFEDSILIKAIIVVLILIIYLNLNKKFKPYNLNNLNELDYFLTNTCIASINLGIGCYISQHSNSTGISYVFITIIFSINIYSILYLFSKILKEFLRQQIIELEQKMNLIKITIIKYFPFLMKFKIISQFLKNYQDKQIRQKYLIKRLKSYLMRIAKKIIIIKNQEKCYFNNQEINFDQFVDSRTITPIISSSKKSLCQRNLIKTNSLILLQQQVCYQINDQKRPTLQFNTNINETISGRQN